MARKVTISEEMILNAALKMLIRDGYSSINIKTLAKELNCSTQPIVWHFENMEGLRKALDRYAREYANKSDMIIKDGVSAFESLGKNYVKMAVNEPNLFKFLYLGESPYEINTVFKEQENAKMAKMIADELKLTKKQADNCIRDTFIYSHGLATLVATNVLKLSEKKMMEVIKDASACFLIKEKNNG